MIFEFYIYIKSFYHISCFLQILLNSKSLIVICLQASCTSKEFECASHNECVPKDKVCDGAGDCHDLSDEAICPGTPSKRFPFVPKKTHEVPEEQKVTVVNSTVSMVSYYFVHTCKEQSIVCRYIKQLDFINTLLSYCCTINCSLTNADGS